MIVFQDLLNFVVLHQHQISFVYETCNKELGDWMKAQSTTWYSHFLMTKYNEDSRWIKHLRITQKFVKQLVNKLKPFMEEKNATYNCAISL
jgi:hypothetical protein